MLGGRMVADRASHACSGICTSPRPDRHGRADASWRRHRSSNGSDRAWRLRRCALPRDTFAAAGYGATAIASIRERRLASRISRVGTASKICSGASRHFDSPDQARVARKQHGPSSFRSDGPTRPFAALTRRRAAAAGPLPRGDRSRRLRFNQFRNTTKLIRVRDQVQIWSESYDREPTSMLGLQRELSAAIAQQIRLRLSPTVWTRWRGGTRATPTRYDLYLRGRNFVNQRTPAR
jgi:hypothetical protein